MYLDELRKCIEMDIQNVLGGPQKMHGDGLKVHGDGPSKRIGIHLEHVFASLSERVFGWT
eukprot:11066534-Karenia_brevis.AAC.1